MLKNSLKFIGKSTFLFAIIISILFVTQPYFLNKIIIGIINLRGSSSFEGEAKSKEVWNIFFGIIFPVVFLISIILMFVIQHYKRKKV
jgi:hypothetical protein